MLNPAMPNNDQRSSVEDLIKDLAIFNQASARQAAYKLDSNASAYMAYIFLIIKKLQDHQLTFTQIKAKIKTHYEDYFKLTPWMIRNDLPDLSQYLDDIFKCILDRKDVKVTFNNRALQQLKANNKSINFLCSLDYDDLCDISTKLKQMATVENNLVKMDVINHLNDILNQIAKKSQVLNQTSGVGGRCKIFSAFFSPFKNPSNSEKLMAIELVNKIDELLDQITKNKNISELCRDISGAKEKIIAQNFDENNLLVKQVLAVLSDAMQLCENFAPAESTNESISFSAPHFKC